MSSAILNTGITANDVGMFKAVVDGYTVAPVFVICILGGICAFLAIKNYTKASKKLLNIIDERVAPVEKRVQCLESESKERMAREQTINIQLTEMNAKMSQIQPAIESMANQINGITDRLFSIVLDGTKRKGK